MSFKSNQMQLYASLEQSLAYLLVHLWMEKNTTAWVSWSFWYAYFNSPIKGFNSSLGASSSFVSSSCLMPSWFNWLLSSLGTCIESSVKHILAVLHSNFLLDLNELAKKISTEFVEISSWMCFSIISSKSSISSFSLFSSYLSRCHLHILTHWVLM